MKTDLIIADYSSLQSNVPKKVWNTATKANVSRYPDFKYQKLKQSIARYAGVKLNQVTVGNGADDLIFLITALFGKKMIVPTPCFITYGLTAKTIGKKIEYLNTMKNGTSKVPKIRLKKNEVLWIANPNNPLGEFEPIKTILSKISGSGLIVIDEAYIEFTGNGKINSTLLKKSNLVILRSFSKGWPLAGMRVGYAISNVKIIQKIENNRLLFPVNSVATELIPELLKKKSFFESERKKARNACSEISNTFQKHGYQTSNSVTNFFCVQFPTSRNAMQFYKNMKKLGVRLLPPSDPEFNGLPANYLRICTPKLSDIARIKKAVLKALITL